VALQTALEIVGVHMKRIVTGCLMAVFLIPNANAAWSEFNGYFTGMSKQAVKQLGVGACQYGTGDRYEEIDDIYCEIPPQNRKLGSLVAKKALLEFKEPYQSVNKILLWFDARKGLMRAMHAAYGESESNNEAIYWERGGPETIYLHQRRSYYHRHKSNIAFVTFEYDAELGRTRQRQAQLRAEAKAKREDTLKNFWTDTIPASQERNSQ
jgi:hypothetical protein